MGIQTMGSQGGGQQPQYQTLVRQSSLYSLTLDEVQNQLGDLGKPLSSMNLDELLKNVWSAEMSQGMVMDAENAAPASTLLPSASGLQHQGSLTLARALSKKTVDEVWRDIQQGQMRNNEEKKAQERQPTLGEMTLEDFLVKAGVVSEGSDKNKRGIADPKDLEVQRNICNVGCVDPMTSTHNFSQQPQWLQYQIPASHHQSQNQQQNLMGAYILSRPAAQALGVNTGPPLDAAYPENQMTISSPLIGTLSDTQTPGRKRVAPGDVVEKTVERRQKRMIKNRESAARSRARKQAYTHELENKISRLEKENENLKKQMIVATSWQWHPPVQVTTEQSDLEKIEMQTVDLYKRNMDLEKILHCAPPPEPKCQLRRTSSAPR